MCRPVCVFNIITKSKFEYIKSVKRVQSAWTVHSCMKRFCVWLIIHCISIFWMRQIRTMRFSIAALVWAPSLRANTLDVSGSGRSGFSFCQWLSGKENNKRGGGLGGGGGLCGWRLSETLTETRADARPTKDQSHRAERSSGFWAGGKLKAFSSLAAVERNHN